MTRRNSTFDGKKRDEHNKGGGRGSYELAYGGSRGRDFYSYTRKNIAIPLSLFVAKRRGLLRGRCRGGAGRGSKRRLTKC